jgi:hypothetical protein
MRLETCLVLSPTPPPRGHGEAISIYYFIGLILVPFCTYLRGSTMSLPSSPSVLQELALPDSSSHDFPKRLCDLLYGDAYTKYVADLKDGDAMELVEYLDKVRHQTVLLHSPPKPA